VLALVGGDHHGGVGRGPLHALLHRAFAVGASVVAPAQEIRFSQSRALSC